LTLLHMVINVLNGRGFADPANKEPKSE